MTMDFMRTWVFTISYLVTVAILIGAVALTGA